MCDKYCAGLIAELIERSGKAVFHTYMYENKIEELANLVTNLEEKIQRLTKEKEDAEHSAAHFKVCLILVTIVKVAFSL